MDEVVICFLHPVLCIPYSEEDLGKIDIDDADIGLILFWLVFHLIFAC